MPTLTTKLSLPEPTGSETVTRAAHDSLVDAIDANAAAQTQVDRPFYLKSLTYDSPNNRIVLTLGSGRVNFLGTLVDVETDSTVYITAPSTSTTYTVYLKSDGTFPYNTSGGVLTGSVPIWQITTGSVVSTLTSTDVRGELAGSDARIVNDAFLAHKAASVLDHPDGSVTNAKLAGGITADKLAGGIGFLTGMMVPYAGTSAPSGWLLCNGAAVSRTTYASLFALVGTSFGAGNGSTTFNVPDLRGRVAIGLDNLGGVAANVVSAANALGVSGGESTHALSSGEIPSHNHSIGGATGGASADHTHGVSITSGTESSNHSHGVGITTDGQGSHTHATDSQGTHTHNAVDGQFMEINGTGNGNKIAFDGAGNPYDNHTSDASAGAHTHTAQTAGAHQHNVNGNTGAESVAHSHAVSGNTGGRSIDHTHGLPSTTGSTGSGTAHNNVQPYVAVGMIIKT